MNPIAVTSPGNWAKHPEVDGVRISINEAAFPHEAWTAGDGFIYEQDNAAVGYFFSEYGTEPPFGFGGDPESDQDRAKLSLRKMLKREIWDGDEHGDVEPRQFISPEWPRGTTPPN